MSTLYTIGHSNKNFADFLELLEHYEIAEIIDVRTIPMSRRFPWFNQKSLMESLPLNHIKYTHLPALGGRRKVNKTSINIGWRHPSFRAYADHMQTEEFLQGIEELNKHLNHKTAIMCAEALPWQCHRSLIADAEVIRDIEVLDIISKTSFKPHQLTPFAVVNKKTDPIQIYYPNKNLDLDI